MDLLARIARAEVALILALLLAVVVYQCLVGRIRLAGILRDKTTNTFDPSRLQLLVLTLIVAGFLMLQLGHSRTELALPSNILLLLYGGSHGTYLVRKYLSRPRSLKGE